MILHRLLSAITRQERSKLNENFDRIERSYKGVIDTSNEALGVAKRAESKSDGAVYTAGYAKITAETTAQQLEDIVINSGTSDAELVMARTDGFDGEQYISVPQRLDKLSEQLKQIASIPFRNTSLMSDNEVIQSAIDSTLSSSVIVPAREYNISADTPLTIPSNTTITFEKGTVLNVIPNGLSAYAVIKLDGVENVRINGLKVIGDSDRHLSGVGEWGNGIEIRNSKNITVDGADISNCWGDGIYIGASATGEIESENITIKNTVCRGNRRLGMALTAVKNVKVMDSHFCDTLGTDPQDGVDIEPNEGFTCENIIFERCEFYNNTGHGLRTSEISGGTIANITAINCIFYNNRRNIMFSKTANPIVRNCIIRDAREEALYIQVDSTDAEVYNNKIYNNALDGIIARVRSYRAVVRNNDIYGNGANGLRITSEGCILQNNAVSENVGRGISVEESPRCEISGNRVLNNGGNGIAVAIGSSLTVVQQNYIVGNAKTTSGYNVLLSANDVIFKGNVVKKGENNQKPLRGLRLTTLNNAWVTDNNLLDSGENERIEVTVTALNVIATNNYPLRTSGTTAQRPTSPTVGFCYFDTNLQKPIWWKGASWADATNTTV